MKKFLEDAFGPFYPDKHKIPKEPIYGYNENVPVNPITPTERREILENLEKRDLTETRVHISIPSVKEIHKSFYTEVDRLLEEANLQEVIKIQNSVLEEKCKAMMNLGFINHPHVLEYNKLMRDREIINSRNETKKNLIACIGYFQQKYPNYKFITMEGISRIAKKYNLVEGPITKFIGEVPNKNLQHMLDFKIAESDKAREKSKGGRFNRYVTNSYEEGATIAPWIIVAPQKDFNMDRSELVDGRIQDVRPVPLDPVVIQPVKFAYSENGSYTQYLIGGLIITAWGDEANDSDVVNEKMN